MEIEEVGRLRVRARADRLPRQPCVALLQVAFRPRVEPRLQPWRDAGEQAPDGLQVSHFAPLGDVAGDALHRHISLQRPRREVAQDGFGHFRHGPHPILAVGFRGLGRRLCSGGRGSSPRDGLQKCTSMIHVGISVAQLQ